MFPPRLAAETLSLRLNEPRCAVSVSAVIDADGDVREYWFGPSTVTVTHAMSDADVDAALREDEENAGKKGAKTHPALALLVEAAARRRRRRERDGAINVATPECIVKVRTREEGSDSDSDGRGKNGGAPLGFLSEDEDDLDGDLDGGEKGGNAGERAANAVRAIESDAMRVELSRQDADSRSRLLVSEMMILAGDLAGALGAEEGVPLPYRRQAPPRDDARAAKRDARERRVLDHVLVREPPGRDDAPRDRREVDPTPRRARRGRLRRDGARVRREGGREGGARERGGFSRDGGEPVLRAAQVRDGGEVSEANAS